ncbi:hypothetical protein C7M84_011820 [Penaeus vannamei]|uniref:Uncharacterized protein n=1 Tax=Penaeus vannamei TaxID=6689 RepID=A0A3R7M2H0_PENVA|nr:hypothetical protein C7M84_011820 [Penaeus vannamei]
MRKDDMGKREKMTHSVPKGFSLSSQSIICLRLSHQVLSLLSSQLSLVTLKPLLISLLLCLRRFILFSSIVHLLNSLCKSLLVSHGSLPFPPRSLPSPMSLSPVSLFPPSPPLPRLSSASARLSPSPSSLHLPVSLASPSLSPPRPLSLPRLSPRVAVSLSSARLPPSPRLPPLQPSPSHRLLTPRVSPPIVFPTSPSRPPLYSVPSVCVLSLSLLSLHPSLLSLLFPLPSLVLHPLRPSSPSPFAPPPLSPFPLPNHTFPSSLISSLSPLSISPLFLPFSLSLSNPSSRLLVFHLFSSTSRSLCLLSISLLPCPLSLSSPSPALSRFSLLSSLLPLSSSPSSPPLILLLAPPLFSYSHLSALSPLPSLDLLPSQSLIPPLSLSSPLLSFPFLALSPLSLTLSLSYSLPLIHPIIKMLITNVTATQLFERIMRQMI